jgi:ribonuclease D
LVQFLTDDLAGLRSWPRLALDLEGSSFHRYHDRVCLLQLSTPEANYLFDPLENELPAGLRALFESSERTLVMHGADYDVLSLRRDYGIVLGRIFDTMLAARFLGAPAVGLQALLAAELGVEIGKAEQRSDWGRRPLSTEQLEYAVRDTVHLLPLAERLEAKLVEVSRLAWLEEECELLRNKTPELRPFDPEGWRQIKGIKGLSDLGLRAARAAYLWRDEAARRQDRAPFRVLGNEVIALVAQRVTREGPEALGKLDRIRGIPKGAARASLLAALRDSPSKPVPPAPPKKSHRGGSERKTLDSEGKLRLLALKAARDLRAKELAFEPGFLAPNALLEGLAQESKPSLEAFSEVEGMTRWRLEAFGDHGLRALRDNLGAGR